MVARIEDSVILTQKLLALVSRNLAEMLVDVNDRPLAIGNRDDRREVEGVLDLVEFRVGIHPDG